MTKRATITLDMPPPYMAVEVVSPGKRNRALLCRYRKGRDYNNKLAQYEAIGIDVYWIIDRQAQIVVVFELEQSRYKKVGEFKDSDIVPCSTCSALALTAEQILNAGSN